ncbi:MAG: hypothetical protein M3460_22535 [Actinomycetota bacterium]|nr:hypothetical protein [Actinomycetota bacterium]
MTEQGPSPVTGPLRGPYPSCGTTTGMQQVSDTPIEGAGVVVRGMRHGVGDLDG